MKEVASSDIKTFSTFSSSTSYSSMNQEAERNYEKNKLHYEKVYGKFSIKNILYWLNDLEAFLTTATTTHTSWFGLYQDNFREKIPGKKVLEMGCGDCTNAAVMATLGAEVYANDITAASGEIVRKLNENYKFQYPIKFVEGDFLKNELSANSFDLVVGKAFLHHLTLPVEKQFLQETARLLKPAGEARFFEPAVNSRILDVIRWYIPVKGRPSKFNKKSFRRWKENDPHPDRSFSSRHWKQVGKAFFKDVKIIPVGTLERFNKFIKNRKNNNKFRRWALKNEKHLPASINLSLTRSQVIIYKAPLRGE